MNLSAILEMGVRGGSVEGRSFDASADMKLDAPEGAPSIPHVS